MFRQGYTINNTDDADEKRLVFYLPIVKIARIKQLSATPVEVMLSASLVFACSPRDGRGQEQIFQITCFTLFKYVVI